MNNNIQLFDADKVNLIKNMFFKGLDDDNLQVFLHICKRTMLDPLSRQIYAVMRNDYKTNKAVMTIQTGIDGYRLIAERTGKYSPGREPSFSYSVEGRIISATAYVKKMTEDGTWHEVAATAYFDEYCQRTKDGKPTQFWLKMGHTMIAKCAEALALRKAFPADLSGIYTKEEMEQAEVENINSPEQASIQIDHFKEDLEAEEGRLIKEFVDQYPDEIDSNIETFFGILKQAWGKPYSYILAKYRDHDLFMRDFSKWKAKSNR
jgi:phage recombination protein Bet